MSFFTKKKEVKKEEAPSLPELPKLPDFNEADYNEGYIHRLPSFPHTPMGTKFSQDTIKEAVTGEKEESSADAYEDEFENEDNMRMMHEPLTPFTKRLTSEIDEDTHMESMMHMEREMPITPARKNFAIEKSSAEPVYVRIDLFEEALDVFNNAKKNIFKIEKDLEDIKKMREKEENELKSWKSEIESLKIQIEKVEKDVFSKV